jgi:hypothetical protein
VAASHQILANFFNYLQCDRGSMGEHVSVGDRIGVGPRDRARKAASGRHGGRPIIPRPPTRKAVHGPPAGRQRAMLPMVSAWASDPRRPRASAIASTSTSAKASARSMKDIPPKRGKKGEEPGTRPGPKR